MIGDGIDELNGNALKKALRDRQAGGRQARRVLRSFDKILKEAASQKFTLGLHAAYDSASERDALMDLEIQLVNADGSPNTTGQRYMQAAGRGDFQEILAASNRTS